MKHAALFRLTLIVLFLLSYQSTTIHTKHHHLGSITQCPICHTAKQSNKGHHHHSVVHFNESIGIERGCTQQHSITRKAFSLVQRPTHRLSDFDGLTKVSVVSIPLGYFSTAPPYFS